MTSIHPPEPGITSAVRAGAAGLYSLEAAITSRDTGLLPCSSGESRILRLAASIAAGIPVDLNDALTGLDQARIALVVRAIRHANGQRPAGYASS